MCFDDLSADRPLGCGRPLRPGGGGGSAEGVEVRHDDAIVQPRHPAARDELQPGGSMPLRVEALHGAGRQIKARLDARHGDVRRVQISRGIIRLPAPIEGHAALAKRHGAALALFGRSEVGAARAPGGIERPGSEVGSLPLRLGDDAVLLDVVRGSATARGDRAHHAVDLQRTGQSRCVESLVLVAGDVRRERPAVDVPVLVLRCGRLRGRQHAQADRERDCAVAMALHSNRWLSSVLCAPHSSVPLTVTG